MITFYLLIICTGKVRNIPKCFSLTKNNMNLIVFFCLIFSGKFQRGNAAGVENPTLRIVGGNNAMIADYPYQVSIIKSNTHFCGGSIINNRFILTAAHCTTGKISTQLSIRVGSSYRTKEGQIYYVSDIYSHPQFDLDTLDYDVSLLKLKKNLIFSINVRAVTLVSVGTTVRDKVSAIATGWGRISDSGKPSDTLQAVILPVITTQQFSERMICAGYDKGGKDTCAGDSGGPLVVSGILVGITSWGRKCADIKSPGVYASVPALRGYIDSILNKK